VSAKPRARQLTTLETLLSYAVLAPSSHNTQPWRFRVEEPSRIRLYADRTRALAVNDPRDRELTMSCGAALETLVLAAREFGFEVDVRVCPDPAEPDCLACLTLTGERWPTDAEASRFVAIRDRQTQRGAFAARAVDPSLVDEIAQAAATEPGVWLVTIPMAWRHRIAALVARGDRQHFGNPQWRAELASWLRPHGTGDGLRLPAVPAWIARPVIRSLDAGRTVGARDAALAEAAPLVAVLGTSGDDPASWVAAGRALQRVLLTAAFHGVQAGFVNQPCQIAALRRQLGHLVGRDGWPQALVRFGHPVRRHRASPRRPLDAVLVDCPGDSWSPLAITR
jgi:nitroreductase